jgi:hypothetical protein
MVLNQFIHVSITLFISSKSILDFLSSEVVLHSTVLLNTSIASRMMGQSFKDSKHYAPLHTKPQGPGDNRPTSLQILNDNDAIGRFHEKVFLVTGGSNGIGVDEVKSFARAGARVFFTSRDLAKGERVRDEIVKELKGEQFTPQVEVIQMDLMKFASVRKAAAEFRSRSDKLNVLVNNAGQSISLTSHHRVC